jgi:hypothetical protein
MKSKEGVGENHVAFMEAKTRGDDGISVVISAGCRQVGIAEACLAPSLIGIFLRSNENSTSCSIDARLGGDRTFEERGLL